MAFRGGERIMIRSGSDLARGFASCTGQDSTDVRV